MIDPKELRIGNLVYSPLSDEAFQSVTCINTQEVTDGVYKTVTLDYHDRVLPEHLSAIPLTEEWLLRFGFQETAYDLPDGYVMKNGRATILIEIAQGGDFNLLYQSDIGLEYVYIRNISVVHKMQNTIYELTDAELTIKTPVEA